MSLKRARSSEQIQSAVKKYMSSRRYSEVRAALKTVSVAELAAAAAVDGDIANRNLLAFSTVAIDYASADLQYTKFKMWISESVDHLKPELAQLLYPLFTHLYIQLLVCCPAPRPQSPAHRFHKRHLATFLGNPEFKMFIQQLGEATVKEELDNNAVIVAFRAAKYTVTLTEQTYKHLMRYLETTESGLLLQTLNQQVDIQIGDPLGSGTARQEAGGGEDAVDEVARDAQKEELTRLEETIRAVREGAAALPSISIYKIVSDDSVASCGEADPGARLLAAGCHDSQVRLFNLLPPVNGDIRHEVGGSAPVLGCDATPRGTCVSIPSGRGRSLRGHSGPVYGVSFLAGERGLVSAGEDTTVRLWDRQHGAQLAVLRGHNYPVWCIATDRLGNIATGSMDRTARLWRPDTAHPLRIYAGHEGDVDCVTFHPNCNYIATGSIDKTVRMWSQSDGSMVRVLTGHRASVLCVSFSPCGRWLASGGEDRRVRVWDLAQGTLLKELKGHLDTVHCLEWSKDSRLLASGGQDGAVKLWDVSVAGSSGDGHSSPELLANYPTGATTVLSLQYSDTNTLVATASMETR